MDTMAAFGLYISVSGGSGDDSIYSGYGYSNGESLSNTGGHYSTINAGKGNDIIYLNGANNNIIQYNLSDGNDTIYGFNSDDTLQIAGSYTTAKSDSDLMVYVGNGSIKLKNTSSANIVTVKGGNSGNNEEKNSWKISGTTAKYGTSKKTLATVKGVKAAKGLGTPSGKKITLKNTALKNKVTVSGSYEFDFASNYKNATISGTAKADTITARGSNLKIFGGTGEDSIKMFGTNQIISGGAGADVFIYESKNGKEKITDFSSNDTLKIGANGDGTYSTVTSDDDVIVSTDDGGKITLVGAAKNSNVNIEGKEKKSEN